MGNKASNPQKPTGTTGPIRITTGPNGGKVEFLPVSFPKTKEAIEDFIIHGFLNTAKNQGILPFTVENITRNKQDDFDFNATTSAGPKYIELMEIAPLEYLGTSYSQAPNYYKPYDFARYIVEKIMGKSEHYASSTHAGIILLLYVTSWQFKLDMTISELLQYWTMKSSHHFESIYHYNPAFKESGIAQIIFPTRSERWSGFNPDKYKAMTALILNPTEISSLDNAENTP